MNKNNTIMDTRDVEDILPRRNPETDEKDLDMRYIVLVLSVGVGVGVWVYLLTYLQNTSSPNNRVLLWITSSFLGFTG